MEKRKSQEEYACEIDGIILRDVTCHQNDWFKIDRPIFLLPENRNKSFFDSNPKYRLRTADA